MIDDATLAEMAQVRRILDAADASRADDLSRTLGAAASEVARLTAERDRAVAALDRVATVADALAAEGDQFEAGSDEYIALHTAAASIRAAAKGPAQ